MRLAYNHAETLLAWQANSWFDLHGELAEERDRRIAAFVAWHRANALPQYARLAEEAARRLERGLTRADVEWGYDAVFAQLRQAIRAGAREAAPLLDRLSPENLSHFEARLAEDNRKFAREHVRPKAEERRRQRLRRMIERLEDWLGELSEAQRERVRRYNDRMPLTGEMRARERGRLQQELLAMLRAREATLRLADWAPHWDRQREPDYAEVVARNRTELVNMLLELDGTLSTEQRAAAVARLRSWAADFERLARR
ncbi:MAG: DUF6279 family lipoprotein [Burkholderiales bacterium]|nr:DUF6279 family lipoprotein [Burkholderiales bacterium]